VSESEDRYVKKTTSELEEIQKMGDELISELIAQNLTVRIVNGRVVTIPIEDLELIDRPKIE